MRAADPHDNVLVAPLVPAQGWMLWLISATVMSEDALFLLSNSRHHPTSD
jgi:hypothetical protein